MKYIFIALLFLAALVIYNLNAVDNTGWIEETAELKELQNKLKKNGYLTDEEAKRVNEIYFEQLREKEKISYYNGV